MNSRAGEKFITVGILGLLICYPFSDAKTRAIETSNPCRGTIINLEKEYSSNIQFRNSLNSAFKKMRQLPAEYPDGNPWIGKGISDLIGFLAEWCTFLPTIDGSADSGLDYIQKFAWFYYKNDYGLKFVQDSPGHAIMQDFVKQRSAFMDSEASTIHIANWLKDDRSEKDDYQIPDAGALNGGFRSWNEFFIRKLRDQAKSQPLTMPARDYIISAPTDCVMNTIPQTIISSNTLIRTKLNQALNISEIWSSD